MASDAIGFVRWLRTAKDVLTENNHLRSSPRLAVVSWESRLRTSYRPPGLPRNAVPAQFKEKAVQQEDRPGQDTDDNRETPAGADNPSQVSTG